MFEEEEDEEEEDMPVNDAKLINYEIRISISSPKRIGEMLENLFCGVLGTLKSFGLEVNWFMKISS